MSTFVKRTAENGAIRGIMKQHQKARKPSIYGPSPAPGRTARTGRDGLITRRSRVRIPPPLPKKGPVNYPGLFCEWIQVSTHPAHPPTGRESRVVGET